MLELKNENGRLNASCYKCGTTLEKTNVELQELSSTGKVKVLDIVCPKCEARAKIELQLGVKENGKK